MKITNALATSTPASNSDTWLWDSEVKGFGVRIRSSGSRAYYIRYRNKQNRQRKMKIARCSDVSASEARNIARRHFSEISQGHDPAAPSDDITFGEFWEMYYNQYSKVHKKPLSTVQDESVWRVHLSKHLANKALKSVTKRDVVQIHNRMRKTPYVANRTVSLVSSMYRLAAEWGYVDEHFNPAQRIKRYREKMRERILTDAEIQQILEALKPWRRGELLVRLLLLTGCRLSEILEAKMEWVDFENRVLRLPDSKTGQKTILLSSEVIRLLETRRGHRLIIGGVHPNHTFKRYLKRIGIEGVSFHTLRHTVGSWAHRNGMSQRDIADLLGHKNLNTTARYIHGSSHRENVEKLSEIIKPRT